MERGQLGQLNNADMQERCGRDEQRIEPFAPDTFEGGIDPIAGVGVENADFKPHSASGSLQVP